MIGISWLVCLIGAFNYLEKEDSPIPLICMLFLTGVAILFREKILKLIPDSSIRNNGRDEALVYFSSELKEREILIFKYFMSCKLNAPEEVISFYEHYLTDSNGTLLFSLSKINIAFLNKDPLSKSLCFTLLRPIASYCKNSPKASLQEKLHYEKHRTNIEKFLADHNENESPVNFKVS